MKKNIFKFLVLVLLFSVTENVSAATGKLGISANVNNAKVGQSVKALVYANGLTGRFNVTSSNTSVLSGGCNDLWCENNTCTCEFKAKSVGSATITVEAKKDLVNHNDDYKPFTGSKSVSIKVISEETKTYNYTNNNNKTKNNSNNNKPAKELSSVNTLKSLSVDEFKLDKEFSKDTVEYNVEVPNETTKVNIKAEATDGNATINGTGEKEVREGNNKLEVKVTAENGDVKTYVVNVKVKELNPINVKVDDKEYTVVRKEDGLDIPENFEKTTVKIDDQDVLAYKNDKLGYTLVALKDKDGNTKFYIYDNGKYTEFLVLDAKGFKVVVLDFPKNKIIKNYKLVEFEVNGIKYKGYASSKNSKVYLIYGKNYETGKENIYQYDSEEGSLQRFISDKISIDNSVNNSYKTPFITATVIASLIVIAYVVTFVIFKKNKKPKLKVNKSKSSINF